MITHNLNADLLDAGVKESCTKASSLMQKLNAKTFFAFIFLIFACGNLHACPQQIYFSWLYGTEPGDEVPSELVDVHKNCFFGDERHIDVSEVDIYAASSNLYINGGNEYLYKRFDGETDTTYFDGISHFIQSLWSENKELFPNKTYVPITSSDITVFVEVKGDIPLLFASPYVERGIVKFQLEQLIGRSWIYGFASPDEQLRALFNNAVEFAVARNISFGQQLAYQDQFHISKDIIWPEIHTINGKSTLVPVVYLSKETLGQELSENTIAFGSADLSYRNVNIDGTKVIAQRQIVIQAQNTSITNSEVAADVIQLEAGSNIELLSTQLTANQIELTAERISNSTLVTRYDFEYDNTVTYTNQYGDTYTVPEYGYGYHDKASQLGVIESFGDLTIHAREDFINQGANLNAQGLITIEAGNSIAIVTQEVETFTYHKNRYWSDETHAISQIQSQLSAEDITLLAGNSITLEASTLEASGTIQLLAEQGIHLIESYDSISKNEYFKFKKGGLFGSSESETLETQKTSLLRTIINAGKSIVVRTSAGNIVLRGVKLDTEGQAEIVADNGFVGFGVAKELDYSKYEFYSEDLMTFKTQGEGHYIENGNYNELLPLGGLAIDAGKGIQIQYFGEGEFDETIDRLANSPELAWMSNLRNDPDVQWSQVELAYEEWDYEAQGLTEIGSLIVAIAVSAVMPGSEAFLTAAMGNTTVATAMAAGASSLATQAASALAANGFDPLSAMQDLGDNLDIRKLATTMATAGMMDYVSNMEWFQDFKLTDSTGFTEVTNNTAEFKDFVNVVGDAQDIAVNAITNATIQSMSSYLIEGGDVGDLGDSFVVALANNSISLIGKEMANSIGDFSKNGQMDLLSKYVAHAAAGCIVGAASGATNNNQQSNDVNCISGAGGAVVGEIIAESYKDSNDVDDSVKATQEWLEEGKEWLGDNGILDFSELNPNDPLVQDFLAANPKPENYLTQIELADLRSNGANLARLGAALASSTLGGDVQIAAQTGQNAAENNGFWFAIPFIIKAIDIAIEVHDVYELIKSVENGDATAADVLKDYVTEKGIDLALDKIIPGQKIAEKVYAAMEDKGLGRVVSGIQDLFARDKKASSSTEIPSRTVGELIPDGNVPSGDRFDDWFDDLTPEELDMVWESEFKKTIESRIRNGGGEHEWCMVCRAPTFKSWGVPMSEIKRFTTGTTDLTWINPKDGLPGGHRVIDEFGNVTAHGSTTFHNELKQMIDDVGEHYSGAEAVEQFNLGIDRLVERWKIDPDLIPDPIKLP